MTAYKASGVTFGRSNADSPETYTTIGQIENINGFNMVRSEIPTDNLSSAIGSFIKGLKRVEPIALVIHYDPDSTEHSNLKTDLDSDTKRNYRITLTDSPAQTITFEAHVTQWGIGDLTPDGLIPLNVTVGPTDSEPVFA